jgi:hypothetical protein
LEKKDCKLGKHLLFRQIGQKTSNSVQNQVVFHEVLPKETVSIAKKYDISIDELEKKSEIVAIYQLVSN